MTIGVVVPREVLWGTTDLGPDLIIRRLMEAGLAEGWFAPWIQPIARIGHSVTLEALTRPPVTIASAASRATGAPCRGSLRRDKANGDVPSSELG